MMLSIFILITGEFDCSTRMVAQRNYQLKDEDDGGRNYNEKHPISRRSCSHLSLKMMNLTIRFNDIYIFLTLWCGR